MSEVRVHLYEIATAFKGLEQLVENGELTPEEAADTFEGIEGDFTAKVGQVLAMMRNHEAFENAAKAEVARLQAAAKSAASRATWLKSYIHAQMNRVGMKSVRTVQGTCSIMPGVATVVVDDVLVLPDDCVEYVPENAYVPKKDVILKRLKALEEGEVFSGAHLNDPVEYLKITRTGKAEE